MTEELTIQGIVPVAQKDVVLLLEVGYLYMELGKNKEAEEVFQGVAALVPNSEVPHMALGHLFFSQGRFNPALKSHEQAVKLNTESAAAWASVGETLFFLRRPDQALEKLDKAIALDPEGSAGEFAQALKEAHGLGDQHRPASLVQLLKGLEEAESKANTSKDKLAAQEAIAAVERAVEAQMMMATRQMQEMNMSFNMQYLQLQQKMQLDNREFNLMSNIMKTKHEAAKNAINNIR